MVVYEISEAETLVEKAQAVERIFGLEERIFELVEAVSMLVLVELEDIL